MFGGLEVFKIGKFLIYWCYVGLIDFLVFIVVEN